MLNYDPAWLVRNWRKTIDHLERLAFIQYWQSELLEAMRVGRYYEAQNAMLAEARARGWIDLADTLSKKRPT